MDQSNGERVSGRTSFSVTVTSHNAAATAAMEWANHCPAIATGIAGIDRTAALATRMNSGVCADSVSPVMRSQSAAGMPGRREIGPGQVQDLRR